MQCPDRKSIYIPTKNCNDGRSKYNSRRFQHFSLDRQFLRTTLKNGFKIASPSCLESDRNEEGYELSVPVLILELRWEWNDTSDVLQLPTTTPTHTHFLILIFDFPLVRYSGVKHAESSLLQVTEIIILTFYITQEISSSQTKCITSKRQKSYYPPTDSTIWWCDMPWKRAANQIKSNQVKSNQIDLHCHIK